MAGRSFETKHKDSAYKGWVIRRTVGLIILAAVFFAAMHLLARADVKTAQSADLIGLILSKVKPESGDPEAPETSSPEGEEGGSEENAE